MLGCWVLLQVWLILRVLTVCGQTEYLRLGTDEVLFRISNDGCLIGRSVAQQRGSPSEIQGDLPPAFFLSANTPKVRAVFSNEAVRPSSIRGVVLRLKPTNSLLNNAMQGLASEVNKPKASVAWWF